MLHRLAVTISLCMISAGTLTYADPLDPVFARIDAAAKSFKGVSADITNTQHTALVDSDEVQTGTFKLAHIKPGQTNLLISLGSQFISLDPQEGKLYNPKTNTVDVKSLSDKQSIVNQLLELGFGATSADLKAAYDITYVGEESIGGQNTSHLKLVPKSADTRRTLKQADLWYNDSGLAAQQKFLYPAGDFKLVKYSNVKLGAIPEKDLQIKLPKNVTVQKH
jgi:outer membrane lipoprotein-sorting protein